MFQQDRGRKDRTRPARALLCVLSLLAVTGLAQDARQRDIPVDRSSPVHWNLPLPNPNLPAQGYPVLQGVEHVEIYHADGNTGLFSHHSQLLHHQGAFFAAWSNHPNDEDAPGQRVLCSISRDGFHWADPFECFPRMDEPARAGNPGRVLTANGWAVIDGTAYAIAEVDEKIGSSGETVPPELSRDRGYRGRRGLGRVARSVGVDGTLGPIFWLVHDPPPPVEGFTSYPDLTDPAFSKPGNQIRRHLSIPLNMPAWDFRFRTNWTFALDGHGLCEPTVYRRRDGVLVKLSRDLARSRRIYASLSYDDGFNWEPALRTNIPDSPSKSTTGTLSDGRTFLIGNQVTRLDGARDPLTIALSRDGRNFDWAAAIRTGAPGVRVAGSAKSPGFQYPSARVVGDEIWVMYTVGKEDVAVSRVPVSILP